MSTLICNGTGNLTGASTFAGAEVGSLALVLNRNTIESLAAAASVTSVSFTITNAKVVDAVLLWIRVAAASPTGTFKVDLQLGGVSQATCTVNKADLPQFFTGQAIGNMVPVLFKLGSNVTSAGGSTYTIVLTTTGTVAVNYAAATASTTNFTRALRTTTAATPAAADDLYVIGELTGAGTNTARTVTMDQTAATAYGNGTVNSTTVAGGGIHVGWKGTFSYGTTASTNYILRINGDLWVWEQGPFSIGASGSEIPRTSTAVLEFQQASASGDFGLRVMDNAVINVAGLSRTTGKNIARCKLTSDVTGSSVLNSGPTTVNSTQTAAAAVDFSGVSLLASTLADTVTNATHSAAYTASGAVTGATQVCQVYLARGSGTNNRFVRLSVGNATTYPHTNGFFADIDLQAGTIGTCTALGNGTATSSAITACGNGFVCTITGKASSASQTPNALINICSAAGTTSFAGAGNQSLIYEGLQLVTAASISTTFNVDTDTGWLSGDVVCVAATSRTATDCENFNLSSNAGASSFSSALYPFGYGGPTVNVAGTHSGTSPTQAEVGLVTRNVKIRSTSSTLLSYVYLTPLCTATITWAEFYYLGLNSTQKNGIETQDNATTNPRSITFCSIHDGFIGMKCNVAGAASLGLTFSSNVIWNQSNAGIVISAATATDYTMDSNLAIKTGSTSFASFHFEGTVTNNTAVGATGVGFNYTSTGATTPEVIGTFSGNIAHSNSSHGLQFASGGTIPSGSIASFTAWRNGGRGINNPSCNATDDLTFDTLTLFGNTTSNILWSSGDKLTINSGAISADASFATTNGIAIAVNSTYNVTLTLSGVDMSGTGTGLAAHTTSDLDFSGVSYIGIYGVCSGCNFGATNTISAKTAWSKQSYIGFEKYKNVSGDHRTEMTYGQFKTDTSIFNTATPSQRLTPNNASNKMASAPRAQGMTVAVNNGDTVTPTVQVRESVVGDGTAYNGNAPRLIVRANPAVGITSDTVLATYSGAAGTFRAVSGTTAAATDDGVMEFIIDCDGTTGWVNADDWSFA